MREARIEQHLVRQVKKHGGEVRKVAWLGRRHAPDRAVFWPGGVLHWVELKAPGEKLRPGQVREHARLRKLGQMTFVYDSVEDVNRYVRFYG